MSKYCIGTALTDPSAKSNRFKEKLLYIKKVTAADLAETDRTCRG